jgi:ABC-type nitrate/sulfonate/bicarbonate transport system ATPase subunit
MSAIDPVLRMSGVAWRTAGRDEPVFAGLDLEIAPGELAVVTSPLGGGKSSVLRLAVGLEEPHEGEVRVLGQPPGMMRHRIGYVAGEGALLANLSLRDNLVLPLRWLDDPPAAEVEVRAREALAAFGVEDLPAVAPHAAPTNLRRIVAMARALIVRPALLLFDEPAAEFDADSAEEMWGHLADLAQARGIAVLAGATSAPRLPAARVVALGCTAVPATRRFSAGQRQTAQLPAIRPGRPHPDIVARKPQP